MDPSTICDPDTELFCAGCRVGDCCDGNDCDLGEFCNNNVCEAEPSECSNCTFNFDCFAYIVDNGDINKWFEVTTLNFGNFTEISYTGLNVSNFYYCSNLENSCDEFTDCTGCGSNRVFTGLYVYYTCYMGNCYRIRIYVPALYDGTHYARNTDDIDTIVCDSKQNETDISTSDLYCTDSGDCFPIGVLASSCNTSIENIDLPVLVFISSSTSGSCPNNCGGSGSECGPGK